LVPGYGALSETDRREVDAAVVVLLEAKSESEWRLGVEFACGTALLDETLTLLVRRYLDTPTLGVQTFLMSNFYRRLPERAVTPLRARFVADPRGEWQLLLQAWAGSTDPTVWAAAERLCTESRDLAQLHYAHNVACVMPEGTRKQFFAWVAKAQPSLVADAFQTELGPVAGSMFAAHRR